jgi:hypothetical protein
MQTSSSRLRLATLLVLAGSAAVPALAAPPGPIVVYVGGNDVVVKAADGKLLNYIVPDGYKFAADGKQMMSGELKPGAQLSGPVDTGTPPQVVSSVAIIKGKVYASTPPSTLTLITSNGSEDFTVPSGTMFMVDGTLTPYSSLKPNTMIEATVITPSTQAANAAPAPATPPMAGALLIAKVESGDLPDAGTNLPLYGVLGAGLLLLGFAALRIRRPASV